ncbi:MAG: Glycine cleavage system H protein - like protein [Chloroflexi bacterium CSP1-4]|nr:MAG: Glycine cleavage system H protein - like protein [Chloroflexi bacterium CSP1-4]
MSEATIRQCHFPGDLVYDVERDLWARQDGDGTLVLGLTDVGQSRAGHIQVVSFSRRARSGTVDRGDALAVLESAKWVGPVTGPVAGLVVALNEVLLVRPKLINLDPYGRGWIVRLRPASGEALALVDGWVRGQEALERYEAKLRLPFRSVAGVDEDFWCVHCNEWDV